MAACLLRILIDNAGFPKRQNNARLRILFSKRRQNFLRFLFPCDLFPFDLVHQKDRNLGKVAFTHFIIKRRRIQRDDHAFFKTTVYQIVDKINFILQKQKIAFASVYAMNPEIYLLDEPSSNLDMTSIQELKGHLRLLQKQGKTILIAEHRLYYLMGLADRIVYLEQGRIEKIFTPEEFRGLPRETRERMGLRAADLAEVRPPQVHPPVSSPVLELRDVTLRYKKRTVLHRISLAAAKGEVIGVVGHNGAGKTTFSRALCGLHKDCEGQFLWDGQAMERKNRLKRSYMVMQDVNYELFAESVEAECSFGIRNPDLTLAASTLEELGLAPYRERHPNTLSGGQKQRVAVAVSMICGKDLLVFDEPTSGLDFDSMTQVAGLIRRLSELGKVIFIVTHDFEFVCRTCSRVLHFDEGEMPDDIPVVMDALPKLRELFSVSDGKER